MLMITPPPRSTMWRLTVCATRNMPRRFTAIIRSQSAAAIARNSSRRAVPALLISTSIPPRARWAASVIRATSRSRLTSPATPATSPADASPARAPSTSRGSRPARKTREPSSRNRRAVASPIPLLPPLISTRLPCSPRIFGRPYPRATSPGNSSHDPYAGLKSRRQGCDMAKQPVGGSEPGGSYSPGIVAEGRFVYVAGQGPFRDGDLAGTGIEEQTRITLGNLAAVLGSAGASLADVVRCGVFLADVGDFAAMDQVYADIFPRPLPAR